MQMTHFNSNDIKETIRTLIEDGEGKREEWTKHQLQGERMYVFF